MVGIINSTIRTLEKSNILLNSLTSNQLSDASIGPYYSSIGSHIRHIYDFYDCILRMDENYVVDLTDRNRVSEIEVCCVTASDYFITLINKIKDLQNASDTNVTVIDDLGLGKLKISYTYSSLLAQANSHTIHHYAIINYILSGLNISFEDCDFGYNPTTPKTIEISR